MDRSQCDRDFSQRFVREVYGSLQQCRAVNTPDPDDVAATRATIAALRIDGARATARLSLVGGGSDRVSGRVALAKDAGHWKLDRFGVDFLRSIIERLPANVPSGEPRKIAGCLRRAGHEVSSRALRQAGNALVGDRFGVPDAFIRCLL